MIVLRLRKSNIKLKTIHNGEVVVQKIDMFACIFATKYCRESKKKFGGICRHNEPVLLHKSILFHFGTIYIFGANVLHL